jgi:hypothetical protein
MDSVPVSCFAPDPLWDSIGDEASRKTAVAAAIQILGEHVMIGILAEIGNCKTTLHLQEGVRENFNVAAYGLGIYQTIRH